MLLEFESYEVWVSNVTEQTYSLRRRAQRISKFRSKTASIKTSLTSGKLVNEVLHGNVVPGPLISN